MNNQDDVWFMYSNYTFKQKHNNGYMDDLFKKAEKYNLKIDVKDTHNFVVVAGDKNELYYDGVLVTNPPKYAIVRRYEIYLGRALEEMGVKVFNNVQAMIDSRNKMKTHQMLAKSGVKTPKTIYVVPMKCLKNVKYDIVCERLNSTKFIMKWVYGSGGDHVYLVDNEKDFDDVIKKYDGKVICQEYIEESFGMDIRAYVIGGKYIGAAIRKSKGGFKSNLRAGGDAVKFDYEEKVEKLAVKAAAAVNLDICGVDILMGKDDYYICEVNCVPGFKSISRTTGADEKDIFLTLIYDKKNNK